MFGTFYTILSGWSFSVFFLHFSMLQPWTTFMDFKILSQNFFLPKSWEQFIASTGLDKVFAGHALSSWEELVKHFSPPSILEELTQLIETTAHSVAFRRNPIAQPGEIFLQPCYHSWHWPQSKTNCTVLRGSSRGSVSLWKLDVENRRACTAVSGRLFFLKVSLDLPKALPSFWFGCTCDGLI